MYNPYNHDPTAQQKSMRAQARQLLDTRLRTPATITIHFFCPSSKFLRDIVQEMHFLTCNETQYSILLGGLTCSNDVLGKADVATERCGCIRLLYADYTTETTNGWEVNYVSRWLF